MSFAAGGREIARIMVGSSLLSTAHVRNLSDKVSSRSEANGLAVQGEGGTTNAGVGNRRVREYQPGDRPGAAAAWARGDGLQSWATPGSPTGRRTGSPRGSAGARGVRGDDAGPRTGSGDRHDQLLAG